MRFSINSLKGDGIGSRAKRGAVLMALNFGGGSGIRLLSNLILTRLLFPEAFGLMTLVQLVVAGATMFSDFGLRDAVVQDKRGDERIFLETAWTLQILRGFILAAGIFFLAPVVSGFFEEPRLEEMLRYCAVVPILQGFNSVGIYSATRNLALGRLTATTLLGQALGVIVTIILAYYMRSVWALVYGVIVGAFFTTLLSHILLPARTRLMKFEMDSAKRLFGFGKYILFATLATFFVNQGDKLILGKFVSLQDLAIYNIGFFLAVLPLLIATAVNDQVIVVLYARIPPSESEENKAKIDKVRWYFTGGSLLSIGFLAVIGIWLVHLLYDVRYYDAGPVLILVALATVPRLIVLSYEKIPVAFGNSRDFAGFKIGTALLQFGLTIVGVQQFGLIGAIIAPALTVILSYPYLLYIIRPYEGWSPRHDLTYFLIAIALFGFVAWLHGGELATVTG